MPTNRKHADVVLVHGAWHSAGCWVPLRERLAGEGIRTHALDLKSSGRAGEQLGDLYQDAQAVRDLIDQAQSPVLLVGHSYGGSVITEASASNRNVAHLLYIATLVTAAGESIIGPQPRTTSQTRATSPISPSPDGTALLIDSTLAADLFYNRCDPQTAAWAVAQLKERMSLVALTQPTRHAGWQEIPSTYLLTTDDHTIDAQSQRASASRTTRLVEVDADHSPFLSALDFTCRLVAELASAAAC